MSLQLPHTRSNTLSEPQPYYRDAIDDNDYESNSFQVQQDRAWLREQLLAGKNSPLCAPITTTHFDELRARVRRTFALKNQ
jgi:chorismate-pyruvate lyase